MCQDAKRSLGKGNKSETSEKGGSLQRGLTGKEQPQEYLDIETRTESPGFVMRQFTVHAGKIVSATLQNRSQEGHSNDWVLVKPGTKKQVQAKAKNTPSMWQWIPETSDILAFVPMTKPGEATIRLFRSPNLPGDYPFFCSVPGRGAIMNGTLHVVR